jgi:hypothetical protein
LPANVGILDRWIDGNGPNARNGISLVKTVAADNPSILLRDHAVETRMRERAPQDISSHAGCRKVGREIVIRADLVEGVITYLPTDLCVFGRCDSDSHSVRQFTSHKE